MATQRASSAPWSSSMNAEGQVQGGGHAARGGNATVADEDRRGVDRDGRDSALQLLGVHPVGRRPLSVQQPGLGEQRSRRCTRSRPGSASSARRRRCRTSALSLAAALWPRPPETTTVSALGTALSRACARRLSPESQRISPPATLARTTRYGGSAPRLVRQVEGRGHRGDVDQLGPVVRHDDDLMSAHRPQPRRRCGARSVGGTGFPEILPGSPRLLWRESALRRSLHDHTQPSTAHSGPWVEAERPRSKLAFALHFVEMVVVMFIGMGIFSGLAALAYAAAGSSLSEQTGRCGSC